MPLVTPRTIVSTPNAPAAIGPYSQAILAGDTLYCSGQIPLDPATGALVSGTVEQETERVLENVGALLKAAGMDYENVVSCTVFMASMDDYATVNEVYARYFSEMPPARAAVAVKTLPRNVRVEIACIAVR